MWSEQIKKEECTVQRSNTYIIIFTLITTVFVGGTLAVVSIILTPIQKRSIELDTKMQILGAVMKLNKNDDVLAIYNRRIISLTVNDKGNKIDLDEKRVPIVAEQVNVEKNYKKKSSDRLLPVFKYVSEDDPAKVEAYILPVYGNGLWNRIWAFVALDESLETIKGISFGHKQETPGLGARIADDPEVSKRFKGKKIYDGDRNLLSVSMIKGEKGEPLDDHHVDGMSGATMTGNGVNRMLKDYFDCYQSYFEKVKSQSQLNKID